MPGIVGIIRREPYQELDRDLRLMVESMRHEANYVGDQYINREIGLYVGWLSHPHSLSEAMPLISHDKQVVLIFLGEHFPHAAKVVSRDSNGSPDGTARALLHLYQESASKFLNSFNDRYGMSRVYIHEGVEEFMFASEAKSILRVRPALRAIDPGSLAEFVRFNCVMGNKSLFKGISLLPPASSWFFTHTTIPRKQKYFDFADWEQQPVLQAKEFYDSFEGTVSSVIPRYWEGAEHVGLSLTSGLDTRMILTCAREQKRSFPCYTFGGFWGDTFDIRVARELAKICNVPHETIRLNEHFLQGVPDYARKSVYVSDGTHDALHGAHDLHFNEIVRNIAPIRLTGKFGSEVVRTRKLIPSGEFPRDLLQPWFMPFLDEARMCTKKAHPLTRVVSEEIPWYEYGRVAVEQSKVVLRTPFMDNELVKLMYQAPSEVRASRDLQARYVKQRGREIAALGTNLGRIVYGHPLVSKASYIPLWALFKVEYIYLYATPHWLTWLDRKLETLRPERFLAGRQKFEGYRIWIKTDLAQFIRETLLSPETRCTEFFQKTSLEKAVLRHIAGTHNYLNEINKMLTVELICSSLVRS
jgi:asparagine synthase (glutamine-hydrolysing)